MFACPQCQFENPIENRFCQRCGNPLKALRAIVVRSSVQSSARQDSTDPSLSKASDQPSQIAEKFAETPPATLAAVLTEAPYLDGDKRYKLRQPLDQERAFGEEIELGILDCHPATESPIAQLLGAEGRVNHQISLEEILPALAYPYWKLQDQFFPVIPELQAAWEDETLTILVLEDRTTWKSLPEICGTSTLESLELIHWFYEMTELWEGLAAFRAEPSLLRPQNLLVDDDQILCLKRLIYRPGDRPCRLKDLGILWQGLLQTSPDTPFKTLETLAIDLGTGTLTDILEVKERLANIADSIQGAAAAEAKAHPDLTDTDSEIELPATLPPELAIAEEDDEKLPISLEDDLLLDDEQTTADDEEPEMVEESVSDLPTMALPMKLYRIDEVGRTHVGRQRAHNEDCFHIETRLQRTDSPSGPNLEAQGLYILCDGMGGHAGGEIASSLAVETLRGYFATHWQEGLPDEETIKAGILQANQMIFEQNEVEGRTGAARMGTTLVMVLLADNQAVVAHVGDSRLYCLTRQGLRQTTVDHEVGQREIKRGVEPAIAYARPDAYQLTQALGPRSNREIAPSIAPLHITQDTLLLLCSDGLSDNDLLETHTETHVKPLLRSRTDLDEGVADLIDLANEHNGHDNITAIAIRVKVRPNLDAIQGQT